MTTLQQQDTQSIEGGAPPNGSSAGRSAGVQAGHSASATELTPPRFRDQPRAVWAVAFACVVSFMGIGLVDPILPIIAKDLHAGASQVSLLFTSYMLVTGVFMLFSGWVSSRIGARWTLLVGLSFIIVFAALAGMSNTVQEIVFLRGGWGIGNALFIATALATIVGASSGGAPRAVMLYEAAMGIGMASGPLLGGLLGEVSWRGPFFGTASLMAVAVILIAALLPNLPKPAQPQSWTLPFKALRHPGIFRLSLTAFLYNMGFFVLLSQAPYPIEQLGAIGIGLVFFGWGVVLALGSVFVAPALYRSFGRLHVLIAAIAGLALTLGAMALSVNAVPAFVFFVVLGGLFLGICNTLLTESIMEVSDEPSSVASAGYSAVRFTGGAIATWVAGLLTEHYSASISMSYGAVAEIAALVVLVLSIRGLRHIDRHIVDRMESAELDPVEQAQALTGADA